MGSPRAGTVLTLQSDVAAANPTRYGIVREWAEGTEWTDRIGNDRGRAILVLPVERNGAPNPDVANAGIMDVLRIDDPDANGNVVSYEYRVTGIDDSATSPVVTITCAPIIADLGRTQIRAVVGGVPSKRVTCTDLRPSEILSTIVIPAANAELGYTITLGTVTPTGRLKYDGTNVTPLALIAWLEEATKSEAWLERTNETTWTLHLGTRGNALPSPVAMVGTNVTALDRTIVDDNQFANRVEPSGATLSGADRPTTCAQAMWNVTGFSSQVATLADPDGGPGPIAFDGQFTGKQLVWPLDCLHWPEARGFAAIAFDKANRVLWGCVVNSGTLSWQNVDTGAVGTLAVSGTSNIPSIVFDDAHDTLYAACADAAKVERISGTSKTSSGNIATTGNPTRLSLVPSKNMLFAAPNDATNNIAAISTATNTLSGTLSTSSLYAVVTYHSGQNRYFAWLANGSSYSWYNGGTLALITSGGTGGTGVGAIADDPGQTDILVTSSGGNQYATVNPSTGVCSAFSALPIPAAQIGGGSIIPRVGSTFYLIGTRVYGFDGTNLVGTPGDAAAGAWSLEVPASGTPTLYVATANFHVRRLALNGVITSFDSATIQACSANAQTVTLPAVGSGGPNVLPNGTRAQIRDDANFALCSRLSDPSSVATYGPIDASPSYGLLGLGNWWRGGAHNEWRNDNTSRWLSVALSGSLGSSSWAPEQKWLKDDQTGLGAQPITLAALFTGGGTPDTTASLTGVGANRVLSPGDIIHNASTLAASTAWLIVRQRTVANGGGAATVPVAKWTGINISAGTVYLTTPALNLGDSQSACTVLAPAGSTPFWSTWYAAAPVPQIAGDGVCWVITHLRLQCKSLRPNNVYMQVCEPYAGSTFLPAVRPVDTAVISDQLRSYWLAQRIDLTKPTHGVVTVKIGVDTSAGSEVSGVLYLQSLAVITSPVSTVDTVVDLLGSAGANQLWQVANARLVTGRNPSVNYRVQVIEDNPAKPFALGATTILRDPARSINAMPRIVSVTRRPSKASTNGDLIAKQPEIELSSLPTSLAQAVASLENAA